MLTSLFEDVGGPAAAAQGNALSFQFWCGDEITVIVSKSGGRYRLQSNSVEAMWLLADELIARLAAYFAAETGPAPPEGRFAISFSEALPLDDFFILVDAHFAARSAVSASTAMLAERATQFRAVQKRLLMRYKARRSPFSACLPQPLLRCRRRPGQDKAPQPLAELSALLEGSFRQLQEAGVAAERAQRDVRRQYARVQARARPPLVHVGPVGTPLVKWDHGRVVRVSWRRSSLRNGAWTLQMQSRCVRTSALGLRRRRS